MSSTPKPKPSFGNQQQGNHSKYKGHGVPRATAVNPLKKKVRDLRRLLAKAESMPADVRLDNERALAAYKQELREAQQNSTEQKMSRKYHMVRFFERQKATRRLKKAQNKLSTAESDPSIPRAELEEERNVAQADLDYIMFYPRDQKYTGLYAGKGEEGADSKMKPAIWHEIRKQRESGTLGAKLNSTTKDFTTKDEPVKSKPKEKMKKIAVESEDGSSDDSEGGFFER